MGAYYLGFRVAKLFVSRQLVVNGIKCLQKGKLASLS